MKLYIKVPSINNLKNLLIVKIEVTIFIFFAKYQQYQKRITIENKKEDIARMIEFEVMVIVQSVASLEPAAEVVSVAHWVQASVLAATLVEGSPK